MIIKYTADDFEESSYENQNTEENIEEGFILEEAQHPIFNKSSAVNDPVRGSYVVHITDDGDPNIEIEKIPRGCIFEATKSKLYQFVTITVGDIEGDAKLIANGGHVVIRGQEYKKENIINHDGIKIVDSNGKTTILESSKIDKLKEEVNKLKQLAQRINTEKHTLPDNENEQRGLNIFCSEKRQQAKKIVDEFEKMISRLGTEITAEEIQNKVVKKIRKEMVNECQRLEKGWQELVDEHKEKMEDMKGKPPNLFPYTIAQEKGIIDCHKRGKNIYVKIGNQFNKIADQIEKITDQFLGHSNDNRVNKKQQKPIRMPIEDDEQSPNSNVDCTNTQSYQTGKRSGLQ